MPDEATLLERVAACDVTALAQVYDDYYDRIYRYVYGYLGRVGSAEDVTADVFFRLLKAVRDGNGPRSHLSAWLYRVAHNLIVDLFRRMPPEESELADWVEAAESDPVHTVEQQVEPERLRQALQQLTECQQQVIILRFFQGMDPCEVASIMGRSVGAVFALQHRSLRALRKALHQEQRGLSQTAALENGVQEAGWAAWPPEQSCLAGTLLPPTGRASAAVSHPAAEPVPRRKASGKPMSAAGEARRTPGRGRDKL